jgi:hypothetical protein
MPTMTMEHLNQLWIFGKRRSLAAAESKTGIKIKKSTGAICFPYVYGRTLLFHEEYRLYLPKTLDPVIYSLE